MVAVSAQYDVLKRLHLVRNPFQQAGRRKQRAAAAGHHGGIDGDLRNFEVNKSYVQRLLVLATLRGGVVSSGQESLR